MTTEEKTICQRCGKAIDKSGSMTQWLFPTSKCACYDDDQLQRELSFCPVCGLRMQSREGTMTGWIFRSKACECLESTARHKRLVPEKIELPADDLVEDEPFEWISVAGQGGMGTVYKAKHRKLDRMIAVKVMQEDSTDPRAKESFLREAKAASKLQHPNIVSVADFGIMKDGRQFLAIEWIDGITLAGFLERHGPLSVESSKEIFIQVLDGLAHAHNRGVVHRDIKPKNIMIGRTASGGWTVKIIDFGTAKDLVADGFTTRAEDMACSPFYVSPERINGLIVDHRADLYSLGCTYFEALTGRPPFTGAALPVVMMHLGEAPPKLDEVLDDKKFPEYLEQFVEKLLKKRPDDRFQSADDAKLALQQMQFESEANPFVDYDRGIVRKSHALSSTIAASLFAVIVLSAVGYTVLKTFAPVENTRADSRLAKKERLKNLLKQQAKTQISDINLLSSEEEVSPSTTTATVDVSDKQKISQIKKLEHLDKLTIRDGQSMPKTLLSGLASQNLIQELNFEDCNLGGATVSPLSGFRNLELLHLRGCLLKEDAARIIAHLKPVKHLALKYCEFEGNAVSEIGETEDLKLLSLEGSEFTDDRVLQLKHLRIGKIELSHNPITGSCFQNLSCKKTLYSLVLHKCNLLTAKGLAYLKDFPKLGEIEIDGTHVTRDVLLALKDVPKLEHVHLPECIIDEDAYPILGHFPRLTRLSLSDTKTKDSNLSPLKKFKELEYLNLKGTAVSPKGLRELRKYCPLLGVVSSPWGDDLPRKSVRKTL